MKNLIVQIGCVVVILLSAAPSRAQHLEIEALQRPASDADIAFVGHFAITNEAYSRQIFRWRAAGWPLLILGTGSVFGGVISQTVTEGFGVPVLLGMLGAVLTTASGILLIRARLMVGRRRRWRRARHVAPTVDVRFTGFGTSLRVSW